MHRFLDNITSTLSRCLCGVSGIILMSLMLLGALDVIARYLFGTPYKGTLNLSEILLVGIVFFSWPYNQRVDGNIKVELFYGNFKAKTKVFCDVLKSAIALFLFIIMTWQSARVGMESLETREIIDVLYIQAYPFKFFVTFGVGVLCLQLLVDLINNLKKLREA